MEELLEELLDLKASFVEVSCRGARSTSITMKDGVASEVLAGKNLGVGIRVLNRGWGFAYTNDMNRLFETAEKALKGSRISSRTLSIKKHRSAEEEVAVKQKKSFSSVSNEERLSLLDEAEEAASEPGRVVSTNLNYMEAELETIYLNSEGARIKSRIPRGALYSQVFAKSNGKLELGMERLGGTGGFELFDEARASASNAAKKALRLLEAGGAPSGSFPVVLDPKLTGVFIHEALGHAVEADHVLQGESVVADKLGKRVASSDVNIYDSPSLEGSFGFYFYDSEGVRAQRTPVVRGGRLESFLHSRETASSLRAEVTGNARAQGFNFSPMPRMSNTYVEPGEQSFKELLEDIGFGIYLKGSKGGEVDPARGVFQFSAEEGFVIRNGELGEGIKDVALSGETLRILQNISAVGGDFELSIGFCGKSSQAVPVGDGGPSVRTFASVGGTG